MSQQFYPLQKHLFEAVYDKIAASYNPNKFSVRRAIIEAYLKCGGYFNIPSENSNTVTASLLQRSQDHLWREFLGKNIVLQCKGADFEIKKGMSFGAKPINAGFSIMLAKENIKPFEVSTLDGYTLFSLSRPLGLREARFRKY